MNLYYQLLPKVVTTFYIPGRDRQPDLGDTTNAEGYAMLRSMPFPCVRIIPEDVQKNELHPVRPTVRTIKNEVVCEVLHGALIGGGTSFLWAGRQRIIANGKTAQIFRPEDSGENPGMMPHSLFALLKMLRDSTKRYIERPVTRQARRAEGITTPDYHEYIIIDRRDVKPDDKAHRWSDIARRHPYLHAVRAHLRRLECGRLVQVRAHTRGKGTLFQVKDYKVA